MTAPPDPDPSFVHAMVSAVRAASRMSRSVQADLVSAGRIEKDDRSPVTVADLAGQAIIGRRLFETFPDVPMMGEEDASVLRGDERAGVRGQVLERVRTDWADVDEDALLAALDRANFAGGPSGRFFCLDPIDGTAGFLRDMQYAVALALVEGGHVTAGVLGCPRLPGPGGAEGAIYMAVRGAGARVVALDGDDGDFEPVRASDCSDLADLRMCESFEKKHSDQSQSGLLREALGVTAEPVRMDSQAKYGVVGSGGAELYLRIPKTIGRSECLWDHAAGVLVVEEAGGRVTDLDGKPLDFGTGPRLTANRGVVASNGAIHDRILEGVHALGF